MNATLFLGFTCLAVLCDSAYGLTPAEEREAKAQLMTIERHLADATTVDEVFSHFDPNVVVFDPFSGETHGIAAIRRAWHEQLDNFANFKADILRITVDVEGDMAFAYSVQHFTATSKVAGKPSLDYVLRQTDCYRKVNDKWLIAHQHLSLPIDPLTDMAIRDSK
jgi:ketosteroid isomerase-like protein